MRSHTSFYLCLLCSYHKYHGYCSCSYYARVIERFCKIPHNHCYTIVSKYIYSLFFSFSVSFMKLQILRINEDNTLYRLCKSILYIQGRFGVQAGGVDCYIKHLINNRNFFKKDITKKSVYIQIQITSYINITYI